MAAFLIFCILRICCQSSVILTPWWDTRSGITCDTTSTYASEQWLDIGSKAWYIDTNGAEETNDWYTQFDISCSLNSSWGLHPSLTSTLSVTINDTNPSGDLIVSFSENDAKWFSVFLDLEKYKKNRIYPSCFDNPNDDIHSVCGSFAIAEGNINDIIENSVANRSNLLGGYPYDWLQTFYPNDCSLKMPVTVTLTNEPGYNQCTVTISDNDCSAAYYYGLGNMFVGNQRLDIYLSMNSPYDIPITIESLEFEYDVTEPTMLPADDPTSSSTASPSAMTNPPSLTPTMSPINPTSDPTIQPSRDPTDNPISPAIVTSQKAHYYPIETGSTVSGITCNISTYTSVEDIIIFGDVKSDYSSGEKVWYTNTSAAIGSDDWYTQFDLTFSLDSTWSFHPLNTSTLSMIINGVNSSDLIISFNDDGNQWFSIFLDLTHNATAQNNRIYPSCTSPPGVVSSCLSVGMQTGSIDKVLKTSKDDHTALFGGHPYEWLETFDSKFCILEMPVIVTLTNDPASNMLNVSLNNDQTDGRSRCTTSLMYTYEDHFYGHNGLDIYLAMNSPHDSPIIVESVEFKYSTTDYNSTTYTSSPSAPPIDGGKMLTLEPRWTDEPTNEPTNSPTNNPAEFVSENVNSTEREVTSSNNELVVILLVVNVIVIIIVGGGIMYYYRRKNIGRSTEKRADEIGVSKVKEEEQIEGAPRREHHEDNEGARAREVVNGHVPVHSFETESAIVGNRNSTNCGDV